jgi:hypothetical protein
MATQQIAQGLSSLGRYGDSTLVHMQPEEVAGLQALAKSQGTSLTIHPETGLPEAFSLGGFFKSLLPTIAGAGLSVASGGALSPLAIGLITGGVTAAATGDLKQGIMGGLGGFGGAGLGSSLQGFGAAAPAANTAVNTAATGAQQVGQASAVAGAGDAAVQNELAQAALMRSGQSQAANAISPGIDFANVPSGGPGIFGASSQPVNFNALYGAQPVASSGAGVNLAGQMSTNIPASGVMNQPAIMSGAKGFEQAGSGISRAFQNPSAYADYVGGTTKALTSVGMPLVGAGLGGLEASDIYGDPMKPDTRGAYDPYATLNLNTDTGLKLYAQGGPVSFADGGDTGKDPAGLPGGGLGSLQGAGMVPLDVSDINARYGYNSTPQQPIAGPMNAMGMGSNANAMPLIEAPRLGLFADNDQIETARTAYESQLKSAMSGRGGMGSPYGGVGGLRGNDRQNSLSGMQGPSQGGMGMMTRTIGGTGMGATAPTAETALSRLNLNKTYANGGTIQAGGIQDLYGTRDDNVAGPALSRDGYGLGRLQSMADGGIAGYKKGGYLDGPGDGMSDSIPATIEGKQPARLADGEFVIPADVVSHLGNGSTKAGSKRLYSMLDKVRHARTGNKKQGKQINPNKFMLA